MTDLAHALDHAIAALDEVRRAAFDESLHPRDERGRFGEKGGIPERWGDDATEGRPRQLDQRGHRESRERYSTSGMVRARLQAAFPNAKIDGEFNGWQDHVGEEKEWLDHEGGLDGPTDPFYQEELAVIQSTADRIVGLYDGLEQIAEQFPEVAARVTSLEMHGPLLESGGDAETIVGPDKVEMNFSMASLIGTDSSSNFSTSGQAANDEGDMRRWSFGVALHEFGHVIDSYAATVEHGAEFTSDDYMAYKFRQSNAPVMLSAWEDEFPNAFANAGDVSTYAMTEPAEYTAEVFALSRLDPYALPDEARDVVEWLEQRAAMSVGDRVPVMASTAGHTAGDGTPGIVIVDMLKGDCIPVQYALGITGNPPITAAFDENLHPRDRGRFTFKDGAPEAPQLAVRDFPGQTGNPEHLTREETGTIPTSAIAGLAGKVGEEPGQRGARRYDDPDWQRLVDNIRQNGIREPIFITVDYGEPPKISEGNARRDVAVELGMPSVPVEIRYFGNAQDEGSVFDRSRAAAIAGPAEIIREIPDKFRTDPASGWTDISESGGRPQPPVEGSTDRRSRESRRAFTEFDETKHPRGEHGRFTFGDTESVATLVEDTTSEGRRQRVVERLNAAMPTLGGEVDLDTMDPDHAEQLARSVEKLAAEFPDVPLTRIRVGDGAGRNLGTMGGIGDLDLNGNPRYFGEMPPPPDPETAKTYEIRQYEQLQAAHDRFARWTDNEGVGEARAGAATFHPVDGAQATIDHELGHAVYHQAERNTGWSGGFSMTQWALGRNPQASWDQRPGEPDPPGVPVRQITKAMREMGSEYGARSFTAKEPGPFSSGPSHDLNEGFAEWFAMRQAGLMTEQRTPPLLENAFQRIVAAAKGETDELTRDGLDRARGVA